MIFEILMLFCFGAAWPLAIYKTIKSPSVAGKSLFFVGIVMMGYFFGVIYKYYYNFDKAIYLYAFNFVMIATDFILTFRKKKMSNINLELKNYSVSLSEISNSNNLASDRQSV